MESENTLNSLVSISQADKKERIAEFISNLINSIKRPVSVNEIHFNRFSNGANRLGLTRPKSVTNALKSVNFQKLELTQEDLQNTSLKAPITVYYLVGQTITIEMIQSCIAEQEKLFPPKKTKSLKPEIDTNNPSPSTQPEIFVSDLPEDIQENTFDLDSNSLSQPAIVEEPLPTPTVEIQKNQIEFGKLLRLVVKIFNDGELFKDNINFKNTGATALSFENLKNLVEKILSSEVSNQLLQDVLNELIKLNFLSTQQGIKTGKWLFIHKKSI